MISIIAFNEALIGFGQQREKYLKINSSDWYITSVYQATVIYALLYASRNWATSCRYHTLLENYLQTHLKGKHNNPFPSHWIQH